MQKIDRFYPILIPTLNRYEHFKICVESLARNTHADKTELVIGLDYPPSDKYMQGYLKIKEYVSTISGFAKITIIKHKTNVGAGGNIRSLREYGFKHYEAVISTEDDNEFSPCFLDYMNKMLKYYKNDKKISSICGYNNLGCYNLSSKQSILLSKDTSAWGLGLWKNKESDFKAIEKDYYSNVLYSFSRSMKLLFSYPASFSMLLHMVMTNSDYGDVKRTTLNILNKTYQCRPLISLVRNHGQDGTGLHSQKDNGEYENQIISFETKFIRENSKKTLKCSYFSLLFRGLSTNPFRALLSIAHILFKYLYIRLKKNESFVVL